MRTGMRNRGTLVRRSLAFVIASAAAAAFLVAPRPAAAVPPDAPAPGSFEFTLQELDSYGRSFGRLEEQLTTPGYYPAVDAEVARLRAFWDTEDREQFQGRPRLTFAFWLPSLFVGDPWRNEVNWDGTHERVYFLNRWGAKLTGDLWGPADLFDAPTPRPLVVITTGSLQGNARMYWWAAQELARRGYVVLTYDVQGQGESETFGRNTDGSLRCGIPDQGDQPPFLRETGFCPGFPFQQSANFGVGAIDAQNWATATPDAPQPHAAPDTGTDDFNPWWQVIDRDRIGIAGHSLGASAVSFVQANPQLVRHPARAVVGWDGLNGCSAFAPNPGGGGNPFDGECLAEGVNTPRIPALNLTSDTFFSFLPNLSGQLPAGAPKGKLRVFEQWRDAGLDVVSITLRGGTHFEYTAIPGVTPIFPATRIGQDVSGWYTYNFFDAYVRDDTAAKQRLTDRQVTFTKRDPLGENPVELTKPVRSFTSVVWDSGVSVDGVCDRDWGDADEPC